MKRLIFISYSIMSFTLMVSLLSCSSDNNASSDISGTPITFSISTTSESQNAANTRSSNEPQEIILDPIKMTSDLDSAVYLNTIISDFPVEEQPTAVTKGSLTTSISSFGVSAYKYSSGTATDATELYIDNNEASVSSSSASTSQTYYWPNNSTDKLAFYAYAPWNNSDVAIQSNRRQIKYTVNSAVTSQQDLLTASSVDNNIDNAASKTVNLTFNHALTAINFVVGSDMIPGTIKSISFENIITAGTYTIGGSWSGTTSSTFTYSLDKNVAGTNGEDITSGNTTLLMIPQQFTADNQKIKIVFNDGKTENTLSFSLKGTSWEEGKSINYMISSSAITNLNIGTISFPNTWTSANFPKSSFMSGDAAGLFIVDANNNIINSNIKLSYDGSSWTHTSALKYSPKNKYFLYYPYQTTLNGTLNSSANDAATFFANVVNNWSISTTSTENNLKSEDLQYAMGTISTTNASTVDFSMAHGMGLAKIILGSKSMYNTITYNGNTDTEKSKTGSVNTYASSSFNGKIPYMTSNYNYIALVKPSTNTVFQCTAGVADSWTGAITANVAANAYTQYTATSARTSKYKAREYSFLGYVEQFTPTLNTTYTLECWGANCNGKNGGYAKGNYNLSTSDKLFIHVGGINADNSIFNYDGSSDLRLNNGVIYTPPKSENDLYGPYYKGGQLGIYQADHKGTDLDQATNIRAYNHTGPNIYYTVTNIQRSKNYIAALIEYNQTATYGLEFVYNHHNIAVATNCALTRLEDIICKGAGSNSSNDVSKLSNSSSTANTNSGTGKVVITWESPL